VRDTRILLTQDLNFSAIIALGGGRFASLISLRLSSSRIERVNSVLERVLPQIEAALLAGSIVTIEDQRIRVRALPLSS
jgi:predicted nuclease of predicted toxin-antitoxin system